MQQRNLLQYAYEAAKEVADRIPDDGSARYEAIQDIKMNLEIKSRRTTLAEIDENQLDLLFDLAGIDLCKAETLFKAAIRGTAIMYNR